MRLVTRADVGQWVKATTQYEKIIAKASTQAMRDVGREGIKGGRAAIGAAGFSSFVQRSLRAINKPPSGYVLNPSVYVHSLINYLDVFETGKTIVGSPLIWLPLPNVPPMPGSGLKFGGIVGREHMTPSQYVRMVGPLVTMKSANGKPMLGAVVEEGGKVTRRRLRQTFLRGVFGEKRKRTHVVPLYVGVPSVTIPKKFDVNEKLEAAAKQLGDFYKKRVEPYEGRR